MGSVTKTFTENNGSNHKATWTVVLSGADAKVTYSGQNIQLSIPTMTAKYVASNKGYGCVYNDFYVYANGVTMGYVGKAKVASSGNNVKMTSGTTYTIGQDPDIPTTMYVVSASSLFNSANPTTNTIAITATTPSLDSFYHMWLESAKNAGGTTNDNFYTPKGGVAWGTIAYIYYQCPPSVTVGTPSYPTPYAGLSSYSVTVNNATAYYGGYIKSITLTLGSQTATQAYSTSTVTNQTLSLTPMTAGTFTPTLTITDSRGQVVTKTLPTITVNAYNKPAVSISTYRTDEYGVKSDEGQYGVIGATVTYTSAVANLTTPAVSIVDNDGNIISKNITWYRYWSSATGVSTAITDWSSISSGTTVYGLIIPSPLFSYINSYVISLSVTDSVGGTSPTVASTLSTAYYTIDFQAGGKEIAFGSSANDSVGIYPRGLFKCTMSMTLPLDVDGSASSTTQATSGDDKDLWNAILNKGWYSAVMNDHMLDVRKVLAQIIQNV